MKRLEFSLGSMDEMVMCPSCLLALVETYHNAEISSQQQSQHGSSHTARKHTISPAALCCQLATPLLAPTHTDSMPGIETN